jgi:hypothetical protein
LPPSARSCRVTFSENAVSKGRKKKRMIWDVAVVGA